MSIQSQLNTIEKTTKLIKEKLIERIRKEEHILLREYGFCFEFDDEMTTEKADDYFFSETMLGEHDIVEELLSEHQLKNDEINMEELRYVQRYEFEKILDK